MKYQKALLTTVMLGMLSLSHSHAASGQKVADLAQRHVAKPQVDKTQPSVNQTPVSVEIDPQAQIVILRKIASINRAKRNIVLHTEARKQSINDVQKKAENKLVELEAEKQYQLSRLAPKSATTGQAAPVKTVVSGPAPVKTATSGSAPVKTASPVAATTGPSVPA